MPKALLSVTDKTWLIEKLAKPLSEMGWNFLASGGTANTLRAANLPVQDISSYTGSPEILGGRVKTLHPAVHAGILAKDSPQDSADINLVKADLIDMVVVNLYPFQKTAEKNNVSQEEIIENIDIGGVALLRAAAKNYHRVITICDPADYEHVIALLTSDGSTTHQLRKDLAVKAFELTAQYDTAISNHLSKSKKISLSLHPIQELRYGENPHQKAVLYSTTSMSGPLGGQLLQGKPVSYNNLLDLDAAWKAVISFQHPTVCIVKHTSPCGIASASNLAQAYPLALASDPVSAFGGVIATNKEFDSSIAAQLGDLFIECIIAPGFTSEALELLSEKKKLRLLSMSGTQPDSTPELRSITNGVLQQTVDLGDLLDAKWKIVTERHPTPEEMMSLSFAWKACQHVKSNAIVFTIGEATVGIGGGQPNRVDCVGIAAQRAGSKAAGAVMASDAFFPFPDVVNAAAEVGIQAIIQPGGSIRDQASIDAANKFKIAMVFTGFRHFRH